MREGWEKKILGEIASVTYGFTGKAFIDGAYRYVRITDIDINGELTSEEKRYLEYSEEAEKFILKNNDLLMARTGATFAKVLLYEDLEPSVFASYLIKIDFKEKIYNKLYWYFSKSENYWEQANSLSTGSAQPHFNGKALKEVVFNYPKSLEEQKQIVAILDKAFTAIDQAKANIEKNIANAAALFQSKLNDIFSQKGDGWKEKTLGEVASYDKTRYTLADKPYVGLEDIESNSGKFLGNQEAREVKSSTFQFDNRHVLYGRLRPYLNKVLLPEFLGHCSTEIFPILPTKELLREFLFYWFLTPSTVEKIDATWTGARMPRANMNEVIKFSIPIPSIEIQTQTSKQLSILKKNTDNIISNYQSKLDFIEDLKKSILQKAFAGELTKKEVAV